MSEDTHNTGKEGPEGQWTKCATFMWYRSVYVPPDFDIGNESHVEDALEHAAESLIADYVDASLLAVWEHNSDHPGRAAELSPELMAFVKSVAAITDDGPDKALDTLGDVINRARKLLGGAR